MSQPYQDLVRATHDIDALPKSTVVRVPVPRDCAVMTALRATAYLLTSLASLLVIALILYGYVELQQAHSTVEDLFGAGGAP